MKFHICNYGYAGLIRALADMGHEVLGQHGTADQFNWWQLLINEGKSKEEYDVILRKQIEEHKPDVFVCGKGWHVDKWIFPETTEWIRDRGILTIYWSLDDPDFVPMFRRLKLYRGYRAALTCATESVPDYLSMGFERVETFWPAWDEVCWSYSEVPESEMTCDFLIVGSPYTVTRPTRRDVAVEMALAKMDLSIYGSNAWVKANTESRVERGYESLRPYYRGLWNDWKNLPSLFAHARMNFSNHRHRAFEYLNDRVPMVLGAGGFLFLDRQPGLERHFLDGTDCVYFDGLEDLASKAVFYKGRPELRHNIGQSGRQRILEGHTYRHRAAQLVKLAEEMRCGSC